MKRTIFLLISLITALNGFSQTPTRTIVLAKDQQLNFKITSKGNITQEMAGQSMETTFDIQNIKNIVAGKASKDVYPIDFVSTKLKMSISMMGNEISKFDSDNKDDMNGSMSAVGKDINVTKKFILNKQGVCTNPDTTAKAKENSTEQADIISKMMEQFTGNQTDEKVIESNFMILPENSKQGDVWKDSIKTENGSSNFTYRWDSTINNIAVIKITGKMTVNSVTQAMGNEATVTITSDITETRKINLSNGIIQLKNTVSQLKGTIEVMGMSVPLTGSVESVTETESK